MASTTDWVAIPNFFLAVEEETVAEVSGGSVTLPTIVPHLRHPTMTPATNSTATPTRTARRDLGWADSGRLERTMAEAEASIIAPVSLTEARATEATTAAPKTAMACKEWAIVAVQVLVLPTESPATRLVEVAIKQPWPKLSPEATILVEPAQTPSAAASIIRSHKWA